MAGYVDGGAGSGGGSGDNGFVTPDTIANILAGPSPVAGQWTRPTDYQRIEMACLSDGTWSYFLDGIEVTEVPTASWAWVNQDIATITRNGPIESLAHDPSAGLNIHCRVRSTPATPWVIRALLHVGGGGTRNIGLLLRESSTGELIRFGLLGNPNGPGWAVQHDSGPTSGLATLATNFHHPSSGIVVAEMADNDTNLFWRLVMPGEDTVPVWDEGRTVRFAGGADQWGFFSASTGFAGHNDLISWAVS